MSTPTTQEKNKEIALMLGWTYLSHIDLKNRDYHSSIKAGWYMKVPKQLAIKINMNLYRGRGHNDLKFNHDANWQFEAIDWIENLHEGHAYTVEIRGHWCIINVNTQWGLAFNKSLSIEQKSSSKKEAIFEALYAFSQYIKSNS